MIRFDFAATFRRVEDRIRFYNEQWIEGMNKDGSPRYRRTATLHSTHLGLLKEAFRLYAKQVNRLRGSIPPDRWPPFETNGPALGKRLMVSDRTIRAWLRRLHRAGLVTERVARGRKKPVLIRFNPELFVLEQPFVSKEERETQQAQEIHQERSAFASAIRQNLPHLNQSDLNKKKNLSRGLSNAGHTQTQGKPSVRRLRGAGRTSPGASRMAKAPARGRRAEIPPNTLASADETRTQAGSGSDWIKSVLSLPDLEGVRAQVLELHELAVSRIFCRLNYLSKAQSFHIVRYFCTELLSIPREQIQEKYFELRTRLQMAGAYMKRKAWRFAPSPKKYFDPDNPKGFGVTRDWFEEIRSKRKRRAEYSRRYRFLMKEWAGFTEATSRFLSTQDFQGYAAGKKMLAGEKTLGLQRFYNYVVLSELQAGKEVTELPLFGGAG